MAATKRPRGPPSRPAKRRLRPKNEAYDEVQQISNEMVGVCPDIHFLFSQFDIEFFGGDLSRNGVYVDWSYRMTLCAGICYWRGESRECYIHLSAKLLQYRPVEDVKSTLAHEMIHALLFINNVESSRDGHGPPFIALMNEINQSTGLSISVYHTMNDEVEYNRKHVWRCDGICQKRGPYFGIIKRAINRKPGPSDKWWKQHVVSCGGVFTKTEEPEGRKQYRGAKLIDDTNQTKLSAFIPSDVVNCEQPRSPKPSSNCKQPSSPKPSGSRLGESELSDSIPGRPRLRFNIQRGHFFL